MARFDRIARVYDLLPIPTHPQVLRDVTADVEGPGLDLGGGTGRFTEAMHPERSPRLLADPSPGMLERARRTGRRVAPLRADGARLPLADDAIGAVTVTEAFHHFAPHQAAIVDEIARVLRPDGVLVVEEIDPDRLLGRLIELGENLVLRFGSRFLEPAELASLVEPRFARVRTERTGSFSYLLEAREPTQPTA